MKGDPKLSPDAMTEWLSSLKRPDTRTAIIQYVRERTAAAFEARDQSLLPTSSEIARHVDVSPSWLKDVVKSMADDGTLQRFLTGNTYHYACK